MITIVYDLEDNDDSTIEVWTDVYRLCIPQCNLDYIIAEIVPKLTPHQSLKQSLHHRMLSSDMLLEISCVYGEDAFEKEPKMLNTIYSACEDINWKIRKLVANRLRRIIPNAPKITKKKEVTDPTSPPLLVEKIEELLTDEENFVKLEALELMECVQYFDPKDVENKFVPKIREIFQKEVKEQEEIIMPLAEF